MPRAAALGRIRAAAARGAVRASTTRRPRRRRCGRQVHRPRRLAGAEPGPGRCPLALRPVHLSSSVALCSGAQAVPTHYFCVPTLCLVAFWQPGERGKERKESKETREKTWSRAPLAARTDPGYLRASGPERGFSSFSDRDSGPGSETGDPGPRDASAETGSKAPALPFNRLQATALSRGGVAQW